MQKGGTLAGDMRNTGVKEAQDRALGADEFSIVDAQTKNNAESAYKDFQRRAWENMIKRRNDWDAKKLELGLDTANNISDRAVDENKTGYDYSKDVATHDVVTYNNGQKYVNGILVGGNPAEDEAEKEGDEAEGQFWSDNVKMDGNIASTVATAGGGGMPGGGGMAGIGGGGGAPKNPGVGGATFNEEEVFGKK
jgi:hypothetical protein